MNQYRRGTCNPDFHVRVSGEVRNVCVYIGEICVRVAFTAPTGVDGIGRATILKHIRGGGRDAAACTSPTFGVRPILLNSPFPLDSSPKFLVSTLIDKRPCGLWPVVLLGSESPGSLAPLALWEILKKRSTTSPLIWILFTRIPFGGDLRSSGSPADSSGTAR